MQNQKPKEKTKYQIYQFKDAAIVRGHNRRMAIFKYHKDYDLYVLKLWRVVPKDVKLPKRLGAWKKQYTRAGITILVTTIEMTSGREEELCLLMAAFNPDLAVCAGRDALIANLKESKTSKKI